MRVASHNAILLVWLVLGIVAVAVVALLERTVTP